MQSPLEMNGSPSHKCQGNLGDAIVSMMKINHSNGAFDSVIGAIDGRYYKAHQKFHN